MSTTSAPTMPNPARSKRPARPKWHYSNWLWIVMFVVIIGGAIYPLIGLAVAVCFLGAVISGIFYGRKWCGTLCPRGSFWDRVMSNAFRKPKMPAWARNKTVRVGVLVALMAAMITQLVFAWGDWEAVGRVFVVLLTVTTAIGVFMALTGHQRAWCMVCPAGTMAAWLGRRRPPKVQIERDACTSCNACARVCPMDLHPAEMACGSAEQDPDCLKCSACVMRCPVGALDLVPELRAAGNEAAAKEDAA